jgi:hypothetical protein
MTKFTNHQLSSQHALERRILRWTGLGITFICLFTSATVMAACAEFTSESARETARGSVFIDDNRNGEREPAEQGVSGVSLSNGCEVVQTDSEGRYQIAISAGEILFISQPAGYKLPVDKNQLPQFYYRHYPLGTPQQIAGTSVAWQWEVTEPTGPLPASIDFALLPDDSTANDFKMHAFADPQARYELSQDMVREELINTLIGNPYGAQFGLTVGDVMNDNLALYQRHKEMMGLIDIPQWYLPGNHDINFESPTSGWANETYKSHFGPTYYSFNYGNVHFIALNNVDYAGAGKSFANGRYRGRLSEDQLYWLERDLANIENTRFIVLASHIPFITEAQDSSGEEPATGPYTENFDQLLEILEPFSHLYAMAGHDTSSSWKVEINHSHGWQGDPWLAHTLAEVRGNGWTRGQKDERGVRDAMMQDGNPNGFYLMRFSATEVVPEFIPFPSGIDGGRRLRASLDPELSLPKGALGEVSINRGLLTPGTQLVVNLFDGGARDSVTASLDGGVALPMSYRVRTDPLAEKLFAQHLGTDSETGRPSRSSHIWQLPLPTDLAAGLHRVVIETKDEFGQANRLGFSFEVLSE